MHRSQCYMRTTASSENLTIHKVLCFNRAFKSNDRSGNCWSHELYHKSQLFMFLKVRSTLPVYTTRLGRMVCLDWIKTAYNIHVRIIHIHWSGMLLQQAINYSIKWLRPLVKQLLVRVEQKFWCYTLRERTLRVKSAFLPLFQLPLKFKKEFGAVHVRTSRQISIQSAFSQVSLFCPRRSLQSAPNLFFSTYSGLHRGSIGKNANTLS